jgi:hypothetical protein
MDVVWNLKYKFTLKLKLSCLPFKNLTDYNIAFFYCLSFDVCFIAASKTWSATSHYKIL